MTRPDARALDQLRPVTFLPAIAPHAAGSVLVSFGNTRVIVAASIEESVPPWMKYQNVSGGWLSAEYSMLPYSTIDRKRRDISSGKLDGRSSEIQRLIGRSMRAVVDLEALGARTLWVDCDVLQADGGTRTAAITGASVAVALAFQKLLAEGKVKKNPLRQLVAAVSAGVFQGTPLLDLCYLEDKDAAADFNVVMTENGEFVEMQGSGEEATFTSQQMSVMLELARGGIAQLIEMQRAALAATNPPVAADALAGLAAAFGGAR
ncbi:MAG: ribonuclease PH [Verrucomicrobiales bacterium]